MAKLKALLRELLFTLMISVFYEILSILTSYKKKYIYILLKYHPKF